MIKKTMILGLLLSAVIFTLGRTETFADNTGIVTATKLNVRSGPSTKYRVVGSLSKNKSATILSSSQGWHKVRLSNNKEAWASGHYIKTVQELNSQELNSNNDSNVSSNVSSNNTNKVGLVKTSKLNIRSGPSTKYRKIGSLTKNNSVTILNSSQGWYKIRLYNNSEGWVSGDYINTNQGSNSNQDNPQSQDNSQKQDNSQNQDKITINAVATAYTGYSTTSTGQKPVWGTIAVDPSVIPYGTKVYIPQFNQVFIANNCGGAIKGNKIDIFMNTEQECSNWGRRTIEIQILGK